MKKFVRLTCLLLLLGVVASPGHAWLDVPIEPAWDGALEAHLDWDNDNGNLFALVRWKVDWHEHSMWSLHMSTDRGSSWTEAYTWLGDDAAIVATDLAVMGGWAYVAYVADHTPGVARLARFWTEDGELDQEFSLQLPFDLPGPITEIELAADSLDSRDLIFYTVLTGYGSVHVKWTDRSAQPVFHSIDPGVSDAVQGLDTAFADEHPTMLLYVTYLAGDELRVHKLDKRGAWDARVLAAGHELYSATDTSVSSYDGKALVVHERWIEFAGHRLMYHYEYPGVWPRGNLFDVSGPICDPKVSARNGENFGLFYGVEDGAFDRVIVRRTEDYQLPIWGPEEPVNDRDWVTCRAEGFDFEWLGGEHGIVYFDNDNRVYFTWASDEFLE